jgi:hypothetical protein
MYYLVNQVKVKPCDTWETPAVKRDIQGKFTLKNDDYRQVRTLRLTDATWMALGMAAECLGITRADLLEQVVRENNLTFPVVTGRNPSVSSSQSVEQLTVLAEQVLGELRLGKQAPSHIAFLMVMRYSSNNERTSYEYLTELP